MSASEAASLSERSPIVSAAGNPLDVSLTITMLRKVLYLGAFPQISMTSTAFKNKINKKQNKKNPASRHDFNVLLYKKPLCFAGDCSLLLERGVMFPLASEEQIKKRQQNVVILTFALVEKQ